MGKRPTGRCPLCKIDGKLLCDSHYLPRETYKFAREDQLSNPNPVMVVHGQLKQVSDQYRGYVLCEECEKRFNDRGERWAIAHIAPDYCGVNPFDKLVAELPPVYSGNDLMLYDASASVDCDMAKLVYFGISIFWRGSVHHWKTTLGLEAEKLELCAYEEPLRKFLMDEAPFPDDVVLTVDIWGRDRVLSISHPPKSSHLPECQRYWFHIPGLIFSLYIGHNIPAGQRLRNAAKGILGIDRILTDSVNDHLLTGARMHPLHPKMQNTLREISEIRAKNPPKK